MKCMIKEQTEKAGRNTATKVLKTENTQELVYELCILSYSTEFGYNLNPILTLSDVRLFD